MSIPVFMTKGPPSHFLISLLGDLVQLRISLSDISRIAKNTLLFPHLVVWLSIYIPKLLNIIREKNKKQIMTTTHRVQVES